VEKTVEKTVDNYRRLLLGELGALAVSRSNRQDAKSPSWVIMTA
jgi:hypothetical protein